MAAPKVLDVSWEDAFTLRIRFDAALDAGSVPAFSSIFLHDGTKARGVAPQSIAVQGDSLLLAMSGETATRLRAAAGGAVGVEYKSYFSANSPLKGSDGTKAASFTCAVPQTAPPAAGNVFLARAAFAAGGAALNSLLSRTVLRQAVPDGGSRLKLDADFGSFVLNGAKKAALSNGGRTVTLSGTKADIEAALDRISIAAGKDAAARAAKGAVLAGTLKASTAAGVQTIRIWSEDSTAACTSVSGGTIWVNGLSNAEAKKLASARIFQADKLYDAEKRLGTGDAADSQMCWAGAAANMLAWAGYVSAQGPVQSEDVAFDAFRQGFSDAGGDMSLGFLWYLDGTDGGYSSLAQNSRPLAEGGMGGGRPAAFQIADFSPPTLPASAYAAGLADAVLAGCAAGIRLDYSLNGIASGHDVACWGVRFDPSKARSDPGWLTGLCITDSDDLKGVASPSDIMWFVALEWDASRGVYKASCPYMQGTDIRWNGRYAVLARKESLQERMGRGLFHAVDSGQTLSGRAVAASSVLAVLAGGSSVKASVKKGASMFVEGTDFRTALAGRQVVLAGGSAVSAAVKKGGRQIVSFGGAAVAATVSSGGLSFVLNGGQTSAASILAGGSQFVSKGGTALGTVASSGAVQYVRAAGSAVSAVLRGGVQSAAGIAVKTFVSSGGVMHVLAGGLASGAQVRTGGSAVFASGASAASLQISAGGSAQFAGTVLTGANVFLPKASAAGALKLASGASLTLKGAGAMTGASLDASGAVITVSDTATKLGSLAVNADTQATFCLGTSAGQAAMLTIASKNAQKLGSYAAAVTAQQRIGSYGIVQNLVQAKDAPWTVKQGSTVLGTVHLNGAGFAKNGVSYSLKAAKDRISLTLAAKAGKMLKGAAGGGDVRATADSDVFANGTGNDTFRNGNGRDCAVYGKENWGQDAITKTAGTLALIFRDLKAADVTSSLAGTAMTFAKKAAPAQKITVAGWDPARHSIVFGGAMSAFAAWASAAAPTAAQAAAARTEVWKKAALA